MSKIYFSVDIETDGVVAGRNNMLSLGAAAIDMETGHIPATFKENLELVHDLVPDENTMLWWKKFPEAYVAARVGALSPKEVMKRFVDWVRFMETKDSLIFAWKPVMDLAFVRYYLHRFHPEGRQLFIDSLFGRSGFGLDQKTVAALALDRAYCKTKISDLPNSLRLDERGKIIASHDHDAMHDAKEQAYILFNSLERMGKHL